MTESSNNQPQTVKKQAIFAQHKDGKYYTTRSLIQRVLILSHRINMMTKPYQIGTNWFLQLRHNGSVKLTPELLNDIQERKDLAETINSGHRMIFEEPLNPNSSALPPTIDYI